MQPLLYVSQIQALEPDDIILFQYHPQIDPRSTDLFQRVFPMFETSGFLSHEQQDVLKQMINKGFDARFRILSVDDNGISDQRYFVNLTVILDGDLRSFGFYPEGVKITRSTQICIGYAFTSFEDRVTVYNCLSPKTPLSSSIYFIKVHVPTSDIKWFPLTEPNIQIGNYLSVTYRFTLDTNNLALCRFLLPGSTAIEITSDPVKRVLQLQSVLTKFGCTHVENNDYLYNLLGQVMAVEGGNYTMRQYFPFITGDSVFQNPLNFRLVLEGGQVRIVTDFGILNTVSIPQIGF